MAHTFIKAKTVVDAASLLLRRQIVLPRLIESMPLAGFKDSENDTVTRRIPAVMTSRSRTIRGGGALVADDLTETSVPVVLDQNIYKLLNISDDEASLDIRNFARQVLNPATQAVAEGVEDLIATALGAVTWTDTAIDFVEGTDDPYHVLVDVRKAMNDNNIPASGRVVVVGSSVEAAMLKSDRISKVQDSGSADALRRAQIGQVAGFTIVQSNALGANEAYAFHRTAMVLVTGPPNIPAGAASGARAADSGINMRFIQDYDPTGASGPTDRALIDTYAGVGSTDDGAGSTNKRGVEINFTPAP